MCFATDVDAEGVDVHFVAPELLCLNLGEHGEETHRKLLVGAVEFNFVLAHSWAYEDMLSNSAFE